MKGHDRGHQEPGRWLGVLLAERAATRASKILGDAVALLGRLPASTREESVLAAPVDRGVLPDNRQS